jgi:hypothetical protein
MTAILSLHRIPVKAGYAALAISSTAACSTGNLLQHAPRSGYRRCGDGKKLRRSSGDDRPQFGFEASEELWTACKRIMRT